MQPDGNQNKKKRLLIGALTLTVLLFPIAYSVIRFAVSEANPDSRPFLEMPDPKYEKCVRDTVYMRFHHMDLLKEIRDDVMRRGVRGSISFSSCRECHTDRERFCNQCHQAVSLNVDCFGCHYYPESARASQELGK